MREELEQKLAREFVFMRAKHLWTGRDLDCPVGVDCLDGWFDLIYSCCKEIDELYKAKNINPRTLIIYQIKEKFGALNFYMGNYIDDVYNIVTRYENMSRDICELCGDEAAKTCGELPGWIYTRCDKCWNEQAIERNWVR